MDDDDTITAERTIPSFPVGVFKHPELKRTFADVGDLVSWLSLIIDVADEDEHWILKRIRRDFIGMVEAP